ncbi:MAG: ATP-binding protein [Spartobacteria bacterium]|nr:ATP-binding protein [Spartobacteria bacterium]
MLSKVFSAAVYGVDAYTVEIEVYTGKAEKAFTVVVGLPDAAVKESKDRVFTAMINSGYGIPQGRTTINLAPANIRKEGPRFDLPMAIATLGAQGVISRQALQDTCIIGELALSGSIRGVNGMLSCAILAEKQGFKRLLVPKENAEEAAIVKGIDVYPIANLNQAVSFLCDVTELTPEKTDMDQLFAMAPQQAIDFSDVKGQESAKRALEVATAGGHNCLMVGSPGTGKSMLAKRIPTILPDMTLDEALETTKIHSIAGKLDTQTPLITCRPFRSPHHTISDAGLLGGGTHPMPGEVSLAHGGVLFLDELPEFSRNVLEVMRQPLEDGQVNIARAAASVTFPCRFMLVAAMNPCPCGYYGDPNRACQCNPAHIQRYRNKISGPLLDRIDIHIEVPAVPYHELTSDASGESSDVIRRRVVKARHIQGKRFKHHANIHCNADMGAREVQHYCRLDNASRSMLEQAITNMNMSARAFSRILKVARTIADLAGEDSITMEHLSESVQFRTLDRLLTSDGNL